MQLQDLAQVVRSKNAGPRRITLDVIFHSDADYQRVTQSKALIAEKIAPLYGVAVDAVGPYYLGSGELATAPAATRRDLRKVLLGALKLKIPLIIGSAGSAGAKPHLEQTLAIIREIAREE